jgi:hypothetical protein
MLILSSFLKIQSKFWTAFKKKIGKTQLFCVSIRYGVLLAQNQNWMDQLLWTKRKKV